MAHISKFKVKNFKGLEDVTLHLRPGVNVLTGVNNSGKTSILEALALWSESFYLLLRQAQVAIKKRKVNRHEWYLDWQYHPEQSIRSVRRPYDGDLFFGKDASLTIELEATVMDRDDASVMAVLPIHISSSRGQMLTVSHPGSAWGSNPALNQIFRRWPQPVRVTYASPVASVQEREEYVLGPKLRALMAARSSSAVLRNRIANLAASQPGALEELSSRLARVLFGGQQTVELKVWSNRDSDVNVGLAVRVGGGASLDVSLLGSGTLQILEMLLALTAPGPDLDIALLDEPDSHIHRDIHRRLLDVLEESSSTQVILTTHNESLLRSVAPHKILHLDSPDARSNIPRVYRPITEADGGRTQRFGLLPSPYVKVMESLGLETSLDLLNALEADHFLLVEGSTDAVMLQALLNKRFIGRPLSGMFWAMGGIDNALRSLPTYKAIFSQIRNARSLWDKATLILDRDYLTSDQAGLLAAAISEKFKVQVFIWPAYTLESTLLDMRSNPRALPDLLQAFLRRELAMAPSPEQILASVQSAHAALKARLSARTLDQAWSDAAGKALRQRSELLAEMKLHGILPSTEQLVFQMIQFQRSAIDRGELQHLANKDDIQAFLSEVCTPFLTADRRAELDARAAWFRELVSGVEDPTGWVEPWKQLVADLLAPRGA